MIKRIVILILFTYNAIFLIPTTMTEAPIPCAQKAYTHYQAVTNTNSDQYALIRTLSVCDDGYLRDEHGFVAAALGSYFGAIGSRWLFVCDDGSIIPIIKVDEKQDIHTDWETHTKGIISGTYDENGQIIRTGEYIEFYVESKNMPNLTYEHINPCINTTPGMDGTIIGWIEVENSG